MCGSTRLLTHLKAKIYKNEKSYTSKINPIRKELPLEEHFKYENAVPAIIPKEIWEQAQFLLEQKPKRNVRASSGNTHHRYTGLIKCGD